MSARAIVLTLLALALSSAAQAQPDEARIGLYVVDIAQINERENTFQIELDVISSWFDPERATGQRQEFSDSEAVKFLDQDWYARAFITNAKAGINLHLIHTTLHPDGRIVNRARLEAIVRAPLDFREFPFDSQDLRLQVESFSHDADALTLVLDEEFSGFDRNFQMPEWEVLGTEASVSPMLREQDQRTYSRLDFSVKVKRQTGYYLWKVVLPLTLITMISWIVFWMGSEGLGRRAGVSATGMLTVIAYQFIIAGSLPRFPYLTVLDKVALLALFLIAATMVENLASARVDEERRAQIDRASRFVFPLALTLGLAAILLPALAS
jgi:hypothetical protein